jgi:hypothetical protein
MQELMRKVFFLIRIGQTRRNGISHFNQLPPTKRVACICPPIYGGQRQKHLRAFDVEPETFEKCSFLFKFKEGDNFNRMNTLSILRIKI